MKNGSHGDRKGKQFSFSGNDMKFGEILSYLLNCARILSKHLLHTTASWEMGNDALRNSRKRHCFPIWVETELKEGISPKR